MLIMKTIELTKADIRAMQERLEQYITECSNDIDTLYEFDSVDVEIHGGLTMYLDGEYGCNVTYTCPATRYTPAEGETEYRVKVDTIYIEDEEGEQYEAVYNNKDMSYQFTY